MRNVTLPSSRIIRIQTWESSASHVDHMLGAGWPRTPGAVSSGSPDVICLNPSDWLVLGTESDEALERLVGALEGSSFRATDLSHALVRIRLEGGEVRDLLAKGSSLDFHPLKFPPKFAARTRFAGMPVVVRSIGLATFELLVARGYADFLDAWIEDAQLEFAGVTA